MSYSGANRMFVRPWGIRFSPEIEQHFRDSYKRASLRRVRVAVILALVLFGGFVLLDAMTLRRTINTEGLLTYALVILPALLGIVLASFVPRLVRWLDVCIAVSILLLGGATYFLINVAKTSGVPFPSESMILVTLYAYFLSGLLVHQAIFVGAAIFVMYTVGEILTGLPRLPGYYDIFFLFGANVLGYAGCFFFEYTLRREYRSFRALSQIATRDELTGLRNRRRFEAHLDRLWRHAAREEKYICLMMIDVDYFKNFNDRYGHPAGDQCLRKVAEALGAEVHRPLDMVARYGGEEFSMLWFDTPPEVVSGLADKVLLAVQGVGMPHDDSPVSNVVTISLGASVAKPDKQGHPPPAFISSADEALYEAKEAGRNCASVRQFDPAGDDQAK